MHTITLRLVTIITEPVLADRIKGDLRRLGAKGWTLTEGSGAGSRGMHAAEVPGSNARLETIVAAEVADRILAHVAQEYFPHYGVIAWVTPVDVVRGEKYV